MSNDSEKLKDFREEIRLTQAKLAQTLNTSLASIGMIECGKQFLSQNIKDKIKKVYNYDIDKGIYITEKEYTTVTSNIIPVPFYHIKVAANPKGELLPDYQEKEALYFDKRWLQNTIGVNPNNCSILEASGDSMQPDIMDSDLLLIDNDDINIINGKIYIIELTTEDKILVKKVKQDINGVISLISLNEKYSPRILTEADNALIKGRVVYNLSRGNI